MLFKEGRAAVNGLEMVTRHELKRPSVAGLLERS